MDASPSQARQIYGGLTYRKFRFVIGLLAILACSFILDIMTGPAFLSVSEVLSALFRRTGADSTNLSLSGNFGCRSLYGSGCWRFLGVGWGRDADDPEQSARKPYTLGVSSAAGFGCRTGADHRSRIDPFYRTHSGSGERFPLLYGDQSVDLFLGQDQKGELGTIICLASRCSFCSMPLMPFCSIMHLWKNCRR